jgi:hypothetical protein
MSFLRSPVAQDSANTSLQVRLVELSAARPLLDQTSREAEFVRLTFLEPLMANGPWAAVLIVCAFLTAFVIMFVCAMLLVERSRRVDAIKAMAELAKALRPGRTKR